MITAERVRELRAYDPETGVFTWRQARRGGARIGEEAGSFHNAGYRETSIDGTSYLGSELINSSSLTIR
jgi:hypothetical protein